MARNLLVFGIGIIAILTCYGCSSPEKCEVHLLRMDETIKNELLDNFNKNDIDYTVRDNGVICMSKETAEETREIYFNIIKKYIPDNFSAILNDDVHNRVIDELDKRDITYNIHILGQDKYIVWNAKNDKTIRKIIRTMTTQHTKEFFSKKKGRRD